MVKVSFHNAKKNSSAILVGFILFIVIGYLFIQYLEINVLLDTYKYLAIAKIIFNTIIFVIVSLGLIYFFLNVNKNDREIRILILVLIATSCLFMFYMNKGPIYSLFSEPTYYSGECELVHSKKRPRIRIEGKDYYDRKGYFYSLLRDDQNLFHCYSNKPCKCAREADFILIDGMNIVVEMKYSQ